MSAYFHSYLCGRKAAEWLIDMNKKLRTIWSIVTALSVLFLSGCATNPEKNIVTSKNDGSFDIGILQSATTSESTADAALAQEMETMEKTKVSLFQWQSQFFSTDGTVEFKTNINEEISNGAMPVVEVAPHFWTEENTRHIAEVLFGDQVFCEAPPKLGAVKDIFSKEELRAAIQRWSVYSNEEALLALFPSMAERKDRVELYLNRIKNEIASCSTLLEEIPEASQYGETKWVFQPDWKYMYSDESVPKKMQANANEQLSVTTTVDDIPYQLIFTRYNGKEYKLNTIFVYPDTVYSPMGIDRDIFRAQLCRTEEPTGEQMDGVKEKAINMLNRMEIGNWVVDKCYLENTNSEGIPEYVIHVSAVPSFEGVAAMYRTQLDNLSENYAPSYYLTEAIMQFSANGDLIYLQLSSPLDIVNVVSENVAVMNLEELTERAKNHLILSDYQAYGLSGQLLESYEEGAAESLVCKIELNRLDYGLIRVKVAGSDDNYYYIPGIILLGTIDYCGKDSGTVYASSGDSFGEDHITPIVALNAIDGSIIDLNKG